MGEPVLLDVRARKQIAIEALFLQTTFQELNNHGQRE